VVSRPRRVPKTLFMGMLEMVNPFKYDGLVTGKDFAGREIEMDEALEVIRNGTNIALFSPRSNPDKQLPT